VDHCAGRVLADRYRLPLPPSDEYQPAETRALDTYSGQEVLVRQVPLPEVVEAETLDADGLPERYVARYGGPHRTTARTTRRPTDPAVRRAVEAAQAAAHIPDHPLLDQVFDVFAEDGSLWIVSELVHARPLAALLADKPLTPYRAAEVAADLLTALRALHAHGWVHRNITSRTVLVCDDGRVMLTGLASGAAEEALCGYDPVRVRESEGEGAPGEPGAPGRAAGVPVEEGGGGAYGADRPPPADGPVVPRGPTHAGPPTGSGSPGSAGACGGAEPGGSRAVELRKPLVPARASRQGPATVPAAERARRRARMAIVGPVTERWAPEQAGPVHENWQPAPRIGPATDLWALGALLFRAVQAHPPYPEENTAELVQMVCSEPHAFAQGCGPLRPVVESLLRQDPAERPDLAELRGWLRSLVRSAPEPEAGEHVIAAPPVDRSRLPIVWGRGEIVRKHRAGPPALHRPAQQAQPPRPRRLGRNLLLVILLALAAVIAYAMVFMPKADTTANDTGGGAGTDRTGAAGGVSFEPEAGSEPRTDQTSPAGSGYGGDDDDKNSVESSSSAQAQSNDSDVAQGFTLRKDSEGFQVAVADGWDRTPKNGHGQVVYARGSFELIVVPGRDTAKRFGSDPLAYQREDERELQPFRDSTWATSGGMRLIEVGGRRMAEGQFTWRDPRGREIFVRNLAILVGGRYHVAQVRGPEAERDEVTRLYQQASVTYQVTE
jgi:serine/threonine protein kinase